MPILTVRISGEADAQLRSKIVEMLQEKTSRILGKKREVIAITIQHINPDNWFIADRSLRDWGKNAFDLTIKITDETNTKNEKAAYLEAVFDGFSSILSPLHETSYIHVEDVRAATYGYGGKTQEYRYQQGVASTLKT